MKKCLFVNESIAVYSSKELNKLTDRLQKEKYTYLQSGESREYYVSSLNSNIVEIVKRGF